MDRLLLRDIEDRTLALAEGDYVGFKTARPVLGTYYERDVSFKEITSIVGRLSNLGLLRWRIRERGRVRFRKTAPVSLQHASAAEFTASPAGIAHLALPRHVV
jgi:hypothetical protein